MNYLDLFSGIGGFRLGLERAGFKFEWIGHSEIDKYAKQVYEGHWPESEDLGDVRTITVGGLPRINLITFGFPCQDLSVAGKRAGLHGNRSGLFFEAMRIIEDTKPEVFIFENVKGLLTKTQSWFARCLQEVADLGLYECEWQLLNTRWFLPQNRERVYFIGHLRGASRPKVFPIGDLSLHATSNGTGLDAQCNKARLCHDNNNKRNEEGTMQLCGNERYLTPLECAKLQGFPGNWHDGLSDIQAYKCYGNAVSVPVVEEIGRRLDLYESLC